MAVIFCSIVCLRTSASEVLSAIVFRAFFILFPSFSTIFFYVSLLYFGRHIFIFSYFVFLLYLGGCKREPHAPVSCKLIEQWEAVRERLMSSSMSGETGQ
jgi:hypothetical protein